MSEQRTERPVIPKQPECNIGTSGHVDSGKCLVLDEYVIFGGKLTTGREIAATLESRAKILGTAEGGTFYELENGDVVSLGADFRPLDVHALLYLQPYDGEIFTVLTKSGRRLSATPEHPLLTNRNGVIRWVKARDLVETDCVAFLTAPLNFDPPDFLDPLPELAKKYRILTYSEYAVLERITAGFTDCVTLDPRQLGLIRILSGVSFARLSKMARIDSGTLKKILLGTREPSAGQLAKIRTALSQLPVRYLRQNEIILESTRNGHASTKMRDPPLGPELMKWFAFVWSEGTSTRSRIAISQSVQKKMLAEFLEITKRNFGLAFRRVSKIDYQVNSTALVDFLSAKFSFHAGAKVESPIASWVLGAPSDSRSAFVRWFFTLDGGFETHGRIAITQANERNIAILGYLLQTFGISARFHEKRVKKKVYHILSVSGRDNLRRFAEHIGFEDPRIQRRLTGYLSAIKVRSKESDLSITVDPTQLENLLRSSSLLREGFPGESLSKAKTAAWYKAYEGCRRTGRISRAKLLDIVRGVDEGLRRLADSVATLDQSPRRLLSQMNLLSISQERMAADLGVSRKRLMNRLRKQERNLSLSMRTKLRQLTIQRVRETTNLLEQFKLLASVPFEFDRLSDITVSNYKGQIFDLSVPQFHNFVAGNGAMIAHNTSIVQAITGVWASAHSEELRRGITIKVGYADAAFYKCHFTPAPASYSTSPKCPVCEKPTELLRAVSFVDAPGHESLMTNMLAGAFLMDGALLVIASNEPVPRPQTREHLQALQMLGMKKIVVVQNKIDLVTDDEAKKNYEAIQGFVAKTVAGDAPIVPISAQQKINIDALIEAIEEVIPTPRRDPNASALMYVVRSFDVNKPGADISELTGGVLGGSLVRGELKVGDEVEILPGIADERGKYNSVTTKVTSLGTGAGITKKVGPGGLVAVGTELDPAGTKGDQMVGSVIGKPGGLPPVWEHITLDLQLFESAVGSAELVKVERVRGGEALRLNLGTASTLATVTSARESVAEVDLKKPVSVEDGARASISRRIADRWRLIGSGVLK